VTAFFDTNVFVYAFLDVEKRERALAVLATGGTISVQVLNEFVNVAHRKHRRSWPDIEDALTVLRAYFTDVAPLTIETHETAVALARDHGLSLYDALIVAAALGAGCDTLFSEDLQHGRAFGRLTVVNPFI
jgi:predicted nucleic acid-binding protein